MTERDKIQKQAVESIRNPARSLLHISQRVGKTKIVIDYIKKHKIKKILWVTPSADLATKDIPEEFETWRAKQYLKGLNTCTYASLHKFTGYYELVVLDEVNAITEKNLEKILLRHLVYTNIIGMTGTPTKDPEKRRLMDLLGLQVDYEILLDKAVEKDLLADYTINIVDIPFEGSKLKEYTRIQNQLKQSVVATYTLDGTTMYITFKSDGRDMRRIQFKKFTEEGYSLYTIWGDILSYGYIIFTPTGEVVTGKYNIGKTTLKITGNSMHTPYDKFLLITRQKALGNSQLKTELAYRLLRKLEGQRNIIFTTGQTQAEALSPNVFHSSTSSIALDKFVAGNINEIAMVNVGGKGFTYKNIDNIIIVQCGNDTNGEIGQKIARGVLKEGSRKLTVWLLRVEDTPDVKWVSEVMKGFSESKTYTLTEKQI